MHAFAKIVLSLPYNHCAIIEHLSESTTIYNPFYLLYMELRTSFGSFSVVFYSFVNLSLPHVFSPFPPLPLTWQHFPLSFPPLSD